MAKYSCLDIAEYFINLANESGDYISNLKIQKMVYYAQAWHLALNDEPLFDEECIAWVHGPAIHSLWKKYKEFQNNPIVWKGEVKKFDVGTLKYLSQVSNVYFKYNAYALEMMTHDEDPWKNARENCSIDEPCQTVITKKSMKDYYEKRLKKT